MLLAYIVCYVCMLVRLFVGVLLLLVCLFVDLLI